MSPLVNFWFPPSTLLPQGPPFTPKKPVVCSCDDVHASTSILYLQIASDGISFDGRRGTVLLALKVSAHGVTSYCAGSLVLEKLEVSIDPVVHDLVETRTVLKELKFSTDLACFHPQTPGTFLCLHVSIHRSAFNNKCVHIYRCDRFFDLNVASHPRAAKDDNRPRGLPLDIFFHVGTSPQVYEKGVIRLHIPDDSRAIGIQRSATANVNIPLDGRVIEGESSVLRDLDIVINRRRDLPPVLYQPL